MLLDLFCMFLYDSYNKIGYFWLKRAKICRLFTISITHYYTLNLSNCSIVSLVCFLSMQFAYLHPNLLYNLYS